MGELFQEADWKTEKHVPVIECPDTVKADQLLETKVGLGKEIAHPSTTEHHIRWISLYFHPENEKILLPHRTLRDLFSSLSTTDSGRRYSSSTPSQGKRISHK
jgi:superoxide reductase